MSLPSVLAGLPGIADAIPALGVLAQRNLDGGGAAGAVGGLIGVLIAAVFGLATLALVIYAVINAVKNPNLSDTERIVWILVILFFNCIGSVLYLVIAKNKGPAVRPPGGM